MEAGIKSATDDPNAVAAEGLEVNLGEAGGGEGGEDVRGDDDGGEPTLRATVHVLTEENFERITRVATGATTGDWFVGEVLR